MASEKISKVFGSFMLPMATRVPVQSAQKPYAAFPLPYMYVLYVKFDHTLSYILL